MATTQIRNRQIADGAIDDAKVAAGAAIASIQARRWFKLYKERRIGCLLPVINPSAGKKPPMWAHHHLVLMPPIRVMSILRSGTLIVYLIAKGSVRVQPRPLRNAGHCL
jgi:hypothetical protein